MKLELGHSLTLWQLDSGKAGESDSMGFNHLGNSIGVVLIKCTDGDAAPISLSCLTIHRAPVLLLH